MVPKLAPIDSSAPTSFRAVLFRMVPKPYDLWLIDGYCFRAVLFRMVPKHIDHENIVEEGFRAVLFRMVPKQGQPIQLLKCVLELCCFEWFQNYLMKT